MKDFTARLSALIQYLVLRHCSRESIDELELLFIASALASALLCAPRMDAAITTLSADPGFKHDIKTSTWQVFYNTRSATVNLTFLAPQIGLRNAECLICSPCDPPPHKTGLSVGLEHF